MANSASSEQNQNHCNNSIPLMQGTLPTLTLSGKIRVTVTFFLFLLSTTFNASFLLKLRKWTLKEKGKKLSRMKVLLKHLTLANLLETLIVMPLDGMWNITVQWYAGELLCKVLSYLKLFSMYAPAFMMVVISLDRSLAITRPLPVQSSRKLEQSMIGLAWLLSSVFAGPQVNHKTTTQSIQEQYTKSTAEDPEDDSGICRFLHHLLDSLLCPRNLVLV
ncbi:gonadotropin-releasing hormone receptor [Octodon degus]|uniref:Gonadotropin-releasing hormone receptor n=1 Tax=Octodon degus TaxID=10160 RepID=A0A6P6DIS2_OCTDE|nr:gonadotropin-releasing hormone receptor [Octodon degus]